MLVLTRHLSEQIVIGDDIVLTVVAINGDRVRIGIDAPKDVPVFRKELLPVIASESPIQKGASNAVESGSNV